MIDQANENAHRNMVGVFFCTKDETLTTNYTHDFHKNHRIGVIRAMCGLIF